MECEGVGQGSKQLVPLIQQLLRSLWRRSVKAADDDFFFARRKPGICLFSELGHRHTQGPATLDAHVIMEFSWIESLSVDCIE